MDQKGKSILEQIAFVRGWWARSGERMASRNPYRRPELRTAWLTGWNRRDAQPELDRR